MTGPENIDLVTKAEKCEIKFQWIQKHELFLQQSHHYILLLISVFSVTTPIFGYMHIIEHII